MYTSNGTSGVVGVCHCVQSLLQSSVSTTYPYVSITSSSENDSAASFSEDEVMEA